MADTSNNKKKQFDVVKYEDGVPIYSTPPNPIQFDPFPENINVIPVEGVEGAFTLENVLSPYECKQFVQLSETMVRFAFLLTFLGL